MKKPFVQFLNGFEIDSSAIIFRYFDLEKFQSLLEKNSLYFTAVKKFTDNYEGSISDALKKLRAPHFQRA